MPDVFSRRFFALPALVGLVTLVACWAAPTASAEAKTCADEVVADWYGDGRVDKIFPLHCYQEAIRSLPVDVLDYSNAKEDILRALAYARQDKPDPGASGGQRPTGTNADPEDPTSTGADPGDPGPGEETTASESVDTSGPSSLPIPLLILGGLALLLLAAGAVGYLSRRAQARRAGGPPGAA